MMADQFSALQKLFPQQPKVAANSVLPAGGVDYSGAFDRFVAAGKAKPAGAATTGDGGGVLSGLGSMLGGVLTAVDTPRAAIASFAKELNDTWASSGVARWLGTHGPDWLITQRTPEEYQKLLEQQGAAGGFSWKDFTNQISEHKGMGDYITQISPNRSLGFRRIVGVAGDIGADPLTWAAPGVANLAERSGQRIAETAAQHAAYQGLDTAIQTGSRKAISEALIKTAEASGFALKEGGGFADEALNSLLVETQKRGAGALTKKSLVSLGIDAEKANQLGIGKLGRTYFHGAVNSPFNALTDFVEGAKGGVKASVYSTKTANFFRGKFGNETLGALRQIVFDSTKSIDQRSQALIAASVLDAPKRTARMWGRLTENGILQDFSGVVRDAEGKVDKVATKAAAKAGALSWHNVADHTAVAATHSLETGGTGQLEDVGRKWFKSIHDSMVEAGVPVGNLGDNYVPHILTNDARVLGSSNVEVKNILETFRDERGFQKFRSLTKGMPFLNEFAGGQNLVEGSVKEINDRFVAAFGVKLFEDDLRIIMPKYLRSAESAMQRSGTFAALEKMGLAGPLLERVERQLNPDRSWVKELADLQARRDVLVGEQQVQLRNGVTVRRDGLLAARVEYAKQATGLRARLRAVDSELTKLEATAARQQTKLEAVTAKLDAAKESVKQWNQQVRSLKGDARLNAVKQLRVAEQTVREQSAELRQLRKTVTEVSTRMNVPTRQLTERLAPMRQRLLSLRSEKSALESQIDGLRQVVGDISTEERNTLLATERNANRSLDTAKARAQQLTKDVTNASDAVTMATNAHLMAQADSAVVKDSLNRSLTEVNTVVDSLTGLPKLSAKQKVRLGLQNDLRERFNTLLSVLNDPNTTPELQAIAGLESAAAQSDMVAADLGDHIGTLNDMIQLTKNKKEIEKLLRVTTHGSVQVAENLQLPQWLFDATTVEHVVKDLTKAGAALDKYMSLFRAYTTFRPGFHTRNAYTALFNMYLEGGVEAFSGIKKWHEFYDMVKSNPQNYMVEAEQKFGAETAAKLNDALEVMYGSGAGQIGSRTAATSYAKGSLNPFDENNRLIQGSRKIGSWVEDHVRGAHAYAVLERGGSKDLASEIVAKWHFNYSDLGSWDRKAKNIVPFWTFFSRNLALQAQTYVRSASRYNRSIKNFERNWNLDSTDPTVVPAYFQKAGAIRLSGGNKPLYWFPDLPATLFPQQLSQLTTPSQLPELLSNVSPLIKTPIEAFAGRSMYTGIPTKDNYVPVPIGLRQLLSVIGGDLPGNIVENTASGPVMKASYAQALAGLLPGFGQIERMVPVSEGNYGGIQGLFTGMTGFGVRQLNEKAVAGENIRRKELAKTRMKYERSLAGFNK